MTNKWIIGNWKMSPDAGDARSLLADLAQACAAVSQGTAIGVCPPALFLQTAKDTLPVTVQCGGQDVAEQDNGAYTGDMSASMLASVGADMVIVGHSERRNYHNEKDQQIARKVAQALKYGLMPVVCVGESLHERQEGKHVACVTTQLRNILTALGTSDKGTNLSRALIAYEPVWAIGTGQVPSAVDIAEMHAAVRTLLAEHGGMRGVLYGGSVKANNACELSQIAGVDGFLVGGASLVADDFMAIVNA